MSEVIATLEDGYTDEELHNAKIDYIETLLGDDGYTYYLSYYKERFANEKAVEAAQGEITPTDAEIQAKFNEYVAANKAAIAEDPLSYIDIVNAGITAYYAPSGVRMGAPGADQDGFGTDQRDQPVARQRI